MKTLTMLLIMSSICHAQEYTEQKMYQKTAEAIAKFYGLDVIGEEALRRIQSEYLPEEFKPYIPYFGTVSSLIVNQKLVYQREF